jgi:hypothetical protein
MFTGIGETTTSPLHTLFPHYQMLFWYFFLTWGKKKTGHLSDVRFHAVLFDRPIAPGVWSLLLLVPRLKCMGL